MGTKIYVGNAMEVLPKLEANSVHCSVSSPPYYGLRKYEGSQQCEWPEIEYSPMSGLPPIQLLGCNSECEHEWYEGRKITVGRHDHGTGCSTSRLGPKKNGIPNGTPVPNEPVPSGTICQKCGGWRGALGNEPTLEMYIGHLVAIYRGVYRVLREDGVVWIVMGDSYAGSWGNYAPGGIKGIQRPQTEKGKRWERKAYDDTTWRPPTSYYPQGNLMMVPHRLALALQADGWIVRNDVVWRKCLSGGAMVYAKTQKGEMPMMVKDMVRLDPSTVKLWDGEKWNQCVAFEEEKPHPDRKKLCRQRIEHKYKTGEELPVMGDIEIELRNGQRIGCTRDHKWPIKGLGLLVKAEDLKIGYVLKSAMLPKPEQPRMPLALDDEDIGWFIGMYIAEGHVYNDKISISSHIKETDRLKRMGRIAEAYDGHVWSQRSSENGMVIFIESPVLLGVIKAYVSGKLARGKHLHIRCWKRSNKFLDALLRGYLEGDGGWDGKRWRLGFCQNDALASDLRTLAARLGYSIRLRRCKHALYERTFPGWRGTLVFDPSYRKQPDTQIIAIRQSRARKFWNISLKDEPHLFALTCGVLTCNSAPMPESVSGWRWQRHRIEVKKSERATPDVYTGMATSPQSAVRGPARNYAVPQENVWQDCPGCPKCEVNPADCPDCLGTGVMWPTPDVKMSDEEHHAYCEANPCPECNGAGKHGGYVLKRGSWRHTRAHEFVLMCTKKMQYFSDQEKVREPINVSVGWRRSHPNKVDSKTQRLSCVPGDKREFVEGPFRAGEHPAGRNPRSVLTPKLEPYPGEHFAVYPTSLITNLIKATCPDKCCPVCGKGWAAIIEKRGVLYDGTRSDETVYTGFAYKQPQSNVRGPARNLCGSRSNILGYRPTCECGYEGLLPGDLEYIHSPTGKRTAIDPSLETGRAGYNRPRGPNEGSRPITRYEQRMYAWQLKNSPYRDEMESEAGSAFAHYIRMDRSGARPAPQELLDRWIEQGWIEQIKVPKGKELKPVPGTCLDPFLGSGTTALVTERLGLNCIGVEIGQEYAEMARDRIVGDAPLLNRVEVFT